MGRGLFGAMAMFYSVGAAASGGGSSLTPPAAIIGAVPQLNFSDVANTGGYLMNNAAAGTIISDGSYYNAGYIAMDAATVGLQMNGAGNSFLFYVNPVTTPGSPFSPTYVMDYNVTSADLTVVPRIAATGGIQVAGGSLPSTGDSLSITKTNIAAKNWTAGTYNALAMQASGFTFQTGTSSITSSLAFDQFGVLTQSHVAQAGAQETLYSVSVADDATGKFRVRNSTPTDNFFLPMLEGTSGSTNAALQLRAIITTDSGTTAGMYFDSRVTGDVTIATRPLFIWANNSTIMSTMLADGSQWWNTVPNAFAAGAYTLGARKLSTITTGSWATGVIEAWANPAGASSAIYTGGYFCSVTNTANAQNLTATPVGLAGTRHFTQNRGAGAVTGAAAILVDAGTNTGGGTITNVYGVYVSPQTVGTNNYGVYINQPTGGTLNYGLLVTGASANAPKIAVTNSSTFEMFFQINTSNVGIIGSDNATPLKIRCNGIDLLQFSTTSQITSNGGLAVKSTMVTAAGPTTITVSDYWTVANPTVTAAATYNLPAAPIAGEEHDLTDAKGIAVANNLTLSGNGKTINGAASLTISKAFGSVKVRYNGTEWNVVAAFNYP